MVGDLLSSYILKVKFFAFVGCLSFSGPPRLYVILYTCLSILTRLAGVLASRISRPPRRTRPASHCVGVGLAVRRGAQLGPPPPLRPPISGMTRAAALLRPRSRSAAPLRPGRLVATWGARAGDRGVGGRAGLRQGRAGPAPGSRRRLDWGSRAAGGLGTAPPPPPRPAPAR